MFTRSVPADEVENDNSVQMKGEAMHCLCWLMDKIVSTDHTSTLRVSQIKVSRNDYILKAKHADYTLSWRIQNKNPTKYKATNPHKTQTERPKLQEFWLKY